jgi:hypothetical protein
MRVRIHFGGLDRRRPMTLLAAAAFGEFGNAAGTSWESLTARALAEGFKNDWTVASSIADSDVVVLGHGYEDDPETRRVAREAKAAGKPCVSFDGRETLPPTDASLGIVYRCSTFVRLEHERTLPVFPPDPRAAWTGPGEVPVPRAAVPKIGFCGYAGSRPQALMLRILGAAQKADGLDLRLKVLRALRSSPRVQCDFIVRHRYFSGTGANPAEVEQARQEYLTNLFGCPYNLAMRGKGNHSVRHYEILAAGRIPVFIDTNCVLPLESVIPWRRHMVWVDAGEVRSVGSILRNCHDSLSPEEFLDLQHRNRELSDRWLQPLQFFRFVLQQLASGQAAP